MPAAKASTPPQIYQLKISLSNARPPIWRRVLVPSDLRLDSLHWVIQISMPWEDSHLHAFRSGQNYYSDPEFELDDAANERRYRIHDLLKAPKDKCVYEYDFGDGWDHVVELEKILAPVEGQFYPSIVKGVRAAPPDDVGGVWRYELFLAALADPSHQDHEMWSDWIGGSWNAEEYDLNGYNDELRSKFAPRKRRPKTQP